MAVDSLGAKQNPVFIDGGAPDIAVDDSAVAAYAALVGNHIVDTTAARTAASAWAWEGLFWSDTTDGFTYRRTSGAWVIFIRPAGVTTRRRTTALTATGSVTVLDFDTADGAPSIADFTYSGGVFTCVNAGQYRVSAQVGWVSGTAVGTQIFVRKGGSSVCTSDNVRNPSGGMTSRAEVVVDVVAGNTIDIATFAASTISVDVATARTFVQIARM